MRPAAKTEFHQLALKGELHLKLKFSMHACLVHYLKIVNTFLKNKMIYYREANCVRN